MNSRRLANNTNRERKRKGRKSGRRACANCAKKTPAADQTRARTDGTRFKVSEEEQSTNEIENEEELPRRENLGPVRTPHCHLTVVEREPGSEREMLVKGTDTSPRLTGGRRGKKAKTHISQTHY